MTKSLKRADEDMSARQIQVIHPTDTVKVVFGAGDEYRYLATGKSTDGEYFLVEAIVPPGGGPPSHIQTREEEAFYILEGQLTFYGHDGEITAGPGTYLNIPKGAKHRFRNNTERTAKMLFFFAPAGIEGLRLFLRQSANVVIPGVVIGLTGALVARQAIAGLLFGIEPLDFPSYVGATVVMLLIAGLGTYVPARRAMRVDPMTSLRTE